MQTLGNIDSADNQGRTPLHYAIMKGEAVTVHYLVHDTGCALDHQDKQGYGPLMWACQSGRLAISQNLLEKQKMRVYLRKY